MDNVVKLSPTMRALLLSKKDIDAKAAKRCREEAEANRVTPHQIALETALRVTITNIGMGPAKEIIRKYLQKHGERL